MSDNTHIEWTDATWNIITVCSVVSPGCTNCYAMKLAGTRLQHHESRAGLTDDSRAGPVWNGQVRFNEQWLEQPLRWRRPRRIFVCAHGDLFHENVPDEWIDLVFAVMALAPQHQFQVLTKRPERMRAYLTGGGLVGGPEGRMTRIESRALDICGDWPFEMRWPLPNVWLGVSVEDQQRADERIPHLLATPAAVRFVSAEPLLGPVDLTSLACDEGFMTDSLTGEMELHGHVLPHIDWLIVGGESGPGARPMHPDWARSLRDQCVAAGVPFFFKQWGAWAPADLPSEMQESEEIAGRWNGTSHLVGKKAAGDLLDGQQWHQMPEVR